MLNLNMTPESFLAYNESLFLTHITVPSQVSCASAPHHVQSRTQADKATCVYNIDFMTKEKNW